METTKWFWRILLVIMLIAAMGESFAPPDMNRTVLAAPQMQTAVTHLVISQVYGGGGESGAPYANDFIELFNPSDAPIQMDGWSIQYADSATITFNVAASLLGSLNPGQYFLVQLASNGAVGAALPNPDATGNTDLSATSGKVILANSTTPISCGNTPCPSPGLAGIIDLVGYGTAADAYEGTAAPAPDASNSDLRKGDGCTDTDNNGQDFTAAAPNPRNKSSAPLLSCTNQFLTATAAANQTATAAANQTATAAASTNTPTATSTPPGSAMNVVISEFRTRGPKGENDEFIELYNPTVAPIDISGWKIWTSNNSGNKDSSPKVTIPAATLLRSGQYYLIANNNATGGYSGGRTADLSYGSGIADDGGIALSKGDNTIVDQVGMSDKSYYKEGTPLTALTSNADQSYERKVGGSSDSCQDTNDNSNDFYKLTPSDPQSYTSGLSLCGNDQPNVASTTITITGDTPDPSLVNRSVTVSFRVSVILANTKPTGLVTVNVSGSTTSCSYKLKSTDSGNGSCAITFTTLGTKILTATYIGDNLHLKSTSPAVYHQVSTSTTRPTATPLPTPLPPPPLLAINEFLPRPGHDWNNDGVINNGDEFIEVLNHGVVNVNLSGYTLDDEVNVGSDPYRLPSVTLRPGERRVFYGSETGILLGDGGDAVRLQKPNGQLADAYNYSVVERPDQSFCRLPDNGGADDWNTNCYPTPGLQNSLDEGDKTSASNTSKELYCPIADTLPDAFVQAECEPFGNAIWNPDYWNRTGWYGDQALPGINLKWPVFAN